MDGKAAKGIVAEKQTGTKARKAKPLLDEADQLRSLKGLLDRLLTECNAVPPEIRQQLDMARRTAWQLFVKQEEEALNTKTS